MTLVLACDEAGHTGPDLLAPDQRIFAFASVNIEDDEAADLISEARSRFPVQMPELKASKLLKTEQGRALTAFLIKALKGRFAVNANDKLVALCGWIFEYIYEPVVQDEPNILYEKNFHRFIAMFTWLWFHERGSDGETAVRQFQAYMRSRDVDDAPLFFDQQWEPLIKDDLGHPFELIQRFAAGYRDVIHIDNKRAEQTLQDNGRWLLDPTQPARTSPWSRTSRLSR